VSKLVLLVDDDAEFASRIASLLERAGCEVITAADGQSAIRILDRLRRQVQLAVIDLNLPGSLSGPELIGTIDRARPRLTSARIVATSGIFKPSYIEMMKELGADATIAKPGSDDEWVNAASTLADVQ
jgi:CheY-like chemotaxis protein